MNTRHLNVTGRVQGVGYRQFIYRNALEFGCTGWVRNRPDGSVEAVIQGATEAVDRLIDAARHGPRHSHVDAVEITAADGRYPDFEIRPTG